LKICILKKKKTSGKKSLKKKFVISQENFLIKVFNPLSAECINVDTLTNLFFYPSTAENSTKFSKEKFFFILNCGTYQY